MDGKYYVRIIRCRREEYVVDSPRAQHSDAFRTYKTKQSAKKKKLNGQKIFVQ